MGGLGQLSVVPEVVGPALQLTTNHSERNIFLAELFLVVERLVGRLAGHGRRLRGAAAAGAALGALVVLVPPAARGALASTTASATTTAAAVIAPADELEILDDHADLAALAAAVLVFPGVELEVPLDEDRLALLAILVDDFARAAPGG